MVASSRSKWRVYGTDLRWRATTFSHNEQASDDRRILHSEVTKLGFPAFKAKGDQGRARQHRYPAYAMEVRNDHTSAQALQSRDVLSIRFSCLSVTSKLGSCRARFRPSAMPHSRLHSVSSIPSPMPDVLFDISVREFLHYYPVAKEVWGIGTVSREFSNDADRS